LIIRGYPVFSGIYRIYEMLHADIGIRAETGRRSMHSKEFRTREKMFAHYERAIAWEMMKW